MKATSVLKAVTYHRTKGRNLRFLLGLAALTSGLLVQRPAKAGVFTPTGPLLRARRNHTATMLSNGKVLVAGGYDTNTVGSAELYDPVAGTWTPTGASITARVLHTATLLLNGKVL